MHVFGQSWTASRGFGSGRMQQLVCKGILECTAVAPAKAGIRLEPLAGGDPGPVSGFAAITLSRHSTPPMQTGSE
eukprot:401909-Amphidinium_carterae.1